MFFVRKGKKITESSSEFSVFIREAKSREKKKIYRRVIEDAIQEQNEVVECVLARTGESG
jgi:hypothetical protein